MALKLVPEAQMRTTCEALGVSRSSLLRRVAGLSTTLPAEQRQHRMLRRISEAERQAILDVLHSERFVDLAVPQIHAQLLDESQYL